MSIYQYVLIKNIIANKIISRIEIKVENVRSIIMCQIHLSDRQPICFYPNLYNTFILTFPLRHGINDLVPIFREDTIDKLIGKKIRTLRRGLKRSYRNHSWYYILETTEGMKYKIRSKYLKLNYQITKLLKIA